MKRLCISILIVAALTPWSVIHGADGADPSGPSIRVRTAEVTQAPISDAQQFTAIVAAYRTATVAAEVGGRITERLLEPGAIAGTGSPLVTIDPERAQLALAQAEAQAQANRVDFEHARHEHQRGIGLFEKNVISQDTLDDLRFQERRALAQWQAAKVQVDTAQRNLNDTRVRAPFDGQIETVHVQVGDFVSAGQPIATLTDFAQARLIAGVTAREASQIQVERAATALFDALGGVQMQALVTSVGRVRDRVNGTYPVEFRVAEEATEDLREGMVASVSLEPLGVAGEQLTVPAKSLVRRTGNLFVYVVDEGKVFLTPVTVGRSDGERVEISSGLTLGQVVVIEGQFALRDGTPVQSSPSLQD